MTDKNEQFVKFFREVAPYIHTHRGKKIVIHLDGSLINNPRLENIVHDIALLNSLGVKLIIIIGARSQIESSLAIKGIENKYVKGLRVTNFYALNSIREIVGNMRFQLESFLSMGLANTPMAEASINVVSGNFVTARPMGIIDGVDLEYTGAIRSVHHNEIDKHLENNNIVLLSPIGFSSTGDCFNLNSLDVATHTAISMQADKAVFIYPHKPFNDKEGNRVSSITDDELDNITDKIVGAKEEYGHLYYAKQASENGVERIHLVNQNLDGGTLLELFTRDGVGLMISKTPFDENRKARLEDITGILELVKPLEEEGVLAKRTRDRMELEINDYIVTVRDGKVIACAALHVYEKEKAAELACLVVHEDYQNKNKAVDLYLQLERYAIKAGMKEIFVLTTQTDHWFVEQGFEETSLEELPITRQQSYNYQRNSKVMKKIIVSLFSR